MGQTFAIIQLPNKLPIPNGVFVIVGTAEAEPTIELAASSGELNPQELK